MYALKFKDSGFEVEVSDGPVDALRMLEQKQDFDVILLDMIMPGMTGVELIKEIKNLYTKIKAKFIVLSNQGQQEDIDEAMTAGADGYIIKAEMVPSDVVKKIEELAK
jgi:two-component system OmpR family response regulator/two-component system chemotaxis response regulator CheY/two-component system response regulator QseB